MATSSAKPKILPLTSARFFAALYVMLYHTLPGVTARGVNQGWWQKVVGMGNISVSFFFMLSGFILAVVYLKGERPVNKRRFFVARFARLYPLYFVAMLLDAPHYFYTQRYIVHGSLWQTIGGFLSTAGLVQAWLNLCSLNPPGWSLSTETFFYIVFPFLGLALWKMRGWAAWGASVLIYAAGLGLVVALDQIQGRDQQPYYPLPYLFVFALGILLAKLFVWIGQSPARSERLESSAPWLLIGSVAGVLAIPLTSIGRHESLLLHGLLAPVFAVAILAFASGNRRIARMFEARWLVVLGEASYGLYLLHIPIHSILRHTIERFGLPMVVLYYVGTIGLSVASYFLLEVPARRWILAKEQVRSVETEVTAALSQ